MGHWIIWYTCERIQGLVLNSLRILLSMTPQCRQKQDRDKDQGPSRFGIILVLQHLSVTMDDGKGNHPKITLFQGEHVWWFQPVFRVNHFWDDADDDDHHQQQQQRHHHDPNDFCQVLKSHHLLPDIVSCQTSLASCFEPAGGET